MAMIETVATIIVCLFGVFLIGVGVFCLIAPRRAIAMIGGFASTTLINFAELVPRLLVGISMILIAGGSRFPQMISVIGWFIAVSSAVLLIIPRKWHSAYAVYWSQKMPVWMAMISAPFTMLAGGALIYAVI